MESPRPPVFPLRKIVAGRYRIQKYVGRGAMGEVYMAFDTTLGDVVALKVAPWARLDVFRGEVSSARQVSHPNVCRVHDLRVHDQLLLLAMEFISGETLETILDRQVGALTAEEKLSITLQLCAGLAAIHERDVVHRDLKPSNVMVKGNGHALITDFGLAESAAAILDPASGTPLYMAPEQLEGKGVSRRSDLYALGLVLFEIFTGRHPFLSHRRERISREELQRRQRSHQNSHQEDASPWPEEEGEKMPGEVAEVIRQCLVVEPADRPGSVQEVIDDLRIELPFRGPAPVYRLLVTPAGGFSRARAWLSLVGIMTGLALAMALGSQVRLTRTAVEGKPPAVLRAYARDLLVDLGFEEPPRDEQWGYSAHPDMAGGPEPRLSPVRFWYRQSPRRLIPLRAGSPLRHPADPPLAVPGEARVELDPRGRLRGFEALHGNVRRPGEPDWERLFAAAGLDPAAFRSASPTWVPPIFADRRWAWETIDSSATPSRVEAAAADGQAVAFRVFARPVTSMAKRSHGTRITEDALPSSSRFGRSAGALWLGIVLVAAAWIARRNLRLATVDATAALRLAGVIFLARALAGFLSAHNLMTPWGASLSLAILGRALAAAALVGVIYIALEPVVRRFSPERAASWVRVVYGRVRDPLVGRDLLIGVLFGLAAVLWAHLYATLQASVGWGPQRLDSSSSLMWMVGQRGTDLELEALASFRQALAMALFGLVRALLLTFLAVVGVLLLRRALEAILLLLHRLTASRQDGSSRGEDRDGAASHPEPYVPNERWWWLSRAAALVVFTVFTFPGAGPWAMDVIAATVSSLLWLVVLLRFGFLSAVAATSVAWLLGSQPATLDFSSWAAPSSAVAWASILAVSAWAFRLSILPDADGDRSPVPGRLLRRCL